MERNELDRVPRVDAAGSQLVNAGDFTTINALFTTSAAMVAKKALVARAALTGVAAPLTGSNVQAAAQVINAAIAALPTTKLGGTSWIVPVVTVATGGGAAGTLSLSVQLKDHMGNNKAGAYGCKFRIYEVTAPGICNDVTEASTWTVGGATLNWGQASDFVSATTAAGGVIAGGAISGLTAGADHFVVSEIEGNLGYPTRSVVATSHA